MDKISQVLNRGVEEVVVKNNLEALLRSGKKIRLYYGIDPTSTQMHLGHTVPLRKLRQFQELGHEVIFLIGDFTALIGDTSDKEAMRKALTTEEIQENFKTYKDQASKVLDFSKVTVKHNSEWLSKLTFTDIVRLASHFTVQQMIERDLYQKRLHEEKPIGLHEFLYPLMQGWDSVEMDVDLEIGGTEQLFNMLAGRELIKLYKNKEKHVLTVPLLLGTDGRKMSKSYGNTIPLTASATDMYMKLMQINDELIIQYFEYLSDVTQSEIEQMKSQIMENSVNPMELKKMLAYEITKQYHGDSAAHNAANEFKRVVQNKEIMEVTFTLKSGTTVLDLSAETSLSRSDIKRLVSQGAVELDGVRLNDPMTPLKDGCTIRVGKKISGKIKLKKE